ncbi:MULTISPECIES: SMI1/KNR4 family protein [Streptomyces]|uniref:SMI1/KNR4 family protein n=1 Tax=Streptomyces siderophoricus TaxID=2802281 RepID=A0ABS1MIX5_9ACTN|nr:SMI1/KNR4 family protein [Streptomyces sp. 9-7]MBL1087983.1 SMI1/KNR4 family protein [Streptomyces sp. 9-7]
MNERDEQSGQEALLSAVHRLAWPGTGDLRCEEAGHPTGHICLTVPSAPMNPAKFSDFSDYSDSPGPSHRPDLSALQEALSRRYGRPRNLAMDGYADPTVTRRTGLPLLTPFGERLVEMRAWAHGSRWIGCGSARFDDGIRPVVLVAEGQDPAADVPEGSSWVGGVVAVTGWDASGRHTVDWAETEARLGTPLPSDYKRLVDLFGDGAFDGYLQLHVPGSCFKSTDLVRQTAWLSEWASATSSALWEPYELYPAPGGLLQWASSEQADAFFWLTEGTDPDRWPILITEDTHDSWVRFDGTTTEFLYRMLTDRQHPFSTARYFDSHWFESYGSDGSNGE